MSSPYSGMFNFNFTGDDEDSNALENYVTLTAEQKKKKQEEENFENLPWYLKYDKQAKEALLGTEELPTALGRGVSSVEGAFGLLNKGRDIATSAIAGVPTQPYRKTLEGAFPQEDIARGMSPTSREVTFDSLNDYNQPTQEELRVPETISKPASELLYKGIETASDPSMLLPMGMLGPVGALATAPVFAPGLISGGAEQIGKGSSEALRENNPAEGNRLIAGGIADLGMGSLMVKHPMEKVGSVVGEKYPSLQENVSLEGTPASQRGAIGPDLSKINSFENSQARKYGPQWREKQPTEEKAYHQNLLKGGLPPIDPMSRAMAGIDDPGMVDRVNELVAEGYPLERASRIAKSEKSEIGPEEHLTPEDVEAIMDRERPRDLPEEVAPLGDKNTPMEAEPIVGTDRPMMALPRKRRSEVRAPKAPKAEVTPPPGVLKSEVEPTEKHLVDDIFDLPKTLRSAFDVSFGGRQGLFLLNRSEGRSGLGQGFKSFKERNHLEVQKDLAARPNAELYKKSGLEQVQSNPETLNARDEMFPSELAQKIPGLKQSERIYTDQGNLIRANVFDKLTEKFTKDGKTFETHPELYQGMSKYLNVLTGRDTLPKRLAGAGYLLNKLLFSPRFIKSRAQLLNPWFYAKLPKEIQMEAIRDVGGTLGTLGILLGGTVAAARQAGYSKEDIDISADPRNSGFGKLKIGKTSYDFFSSLLPLVRTAARITTGEKVTPSGEYALPGLSGRTLLGGESDLPKAPFGASVGQEIATLGQGKLAPVASASIGLATGKGYGGEEYGLAQAARDTLAPMAITEFVQAYKDHGYEEALKTLPGLLGVGVQTESVAKSSGGSKSSSSGGGSRLKLGKGKSKRKSKYNFL